MVAGWDCFVSLWFHSPQTILNLFSSSFFTLFGRYLPTKCARLSDSKWPPRPANYKVSNPIGPNGPGSAPRPIVVVVVGNNFCLFQTTQS